MTAIIFGPQEPLFGDRQTTRQKERLSVIQGTIEGGRCRQRQKKSWMYSVEQLTSIPMDEVLSVAHTRSGWRRISATYYLFSPTARPPKGIMMMIIMLLLLLMMIFTYILIRGDNHGIVKMATSMPRQAFFAVLYPFLLLLIFKSLSHSSHI
ncbi:hypothetical protein DPMN_043039 [Dreissena polymorpha]|nr:hypothetical protein DPMN_043039 [Dreissena polymorpha]